MLGLTALLVLGGTVFFLWSEGDNPATLGDMPLEEKCLNAFFQSVTLRTAGFNVVDQGALRESSLLVSCLFMLIGGSSGSTAGGLKTVTVWILVMVAVTNLRGREGVTFHGRSIPARRCMNAVTLFLMVFLLFLGASLVLTATGQAAFLPAAVETASALGTVGLTTGITPTLARPAQALLIFLMYTGRVGVLSLSLAFLVRRRDGLNIRYPEFRVMIG